jgi:hypothetical protein
MPSFRDRLVSSDAQIRLRSNGVPVAEIAERLEAGSSLAGLHGHTPLSPMDLIAALAWAGLGAADSLGPGLVQGKPRRPRLAQALSETALATLFPACSLKSRLALEAGLSQIHDFWGASHTAAQRADDLGERDVSAYWHGIAHRREPDPGNATYWFRRVGRHPVFEPLAAAARPYLDEHGDSSLTGSLLGGECWNALAMIELCSQARPGSAREALARRLQRLEMSLLLDATVAQLDSL